MTPAEMFRREPESAHWIVVGHRLVKLAFVFEQAPACPGPCCVPEEDGDRWRVDVCAHHAKELT